MAKRGTASIEPEARAAARRDAEPVAISVVIVNYNVKEFLQQALVSVLKALAGRTAEVIVVDNASSDGSVEMVRAVFPEVILAANDINAGFARSCNQGISMSRGEVVVLLNPDTIVQEDTFNETLRFFAEHEDTGMLGCKILNPDGTLQLACRRSFPTPWVAFTKLSGLSRLFSKSRLFGRYNLTYLDPDEVCEVEAISGSFMAVRRQTIQEVGLLDEAFFMYGEDLDWCYRIHRSGWKVVYFPGTQIIHFKGESSKKAQFDSLRTFYQAMGLFTRKHFKRKSLLLPYWMLRGAIWLRAGVSFLANFLREVCVPLTDMLLLSGSIVLSVYIRFSGLRSLASFVPVIVGYTAVWMVSLKFFGALAQDRFSSSKAALAVGAGFFANAGLTFFFNQYAFSRAVVLLSGAICLGIIPGWRLLIKILPRLGFLPFRGTLGKTLLARTTVIVGDVDSARKLIRKLRSRIDSGYEITGVVSANGAHIGKEIEGVRVIGEVCELTGLIRNRNIQEVIFSTQQVSYDQILKVIAAAGDQRVNFKLIPSNLDVILGKASIDRLDDVPLVAIDNKLRLRSHQTGKRAFDILISGILILTTWPLFLLKKYLSSGRLLERNVKGLAGEFVAHELAGANGWLRRWPYLRNIFLGQMSFVGGEIVDAAEERDSAAEALPLKPGLTGLVQVNSRLHLSPADKEKYQFYYLKNHSLLLDLEIIFKAIFRI